MIQKFDFSDFYSICDRLSASDADLAGVIRVHGYPPLWQRPNTFESLVHIILEQQVSLASALSALNKLRENVKEITPAAVLQLSDQEFRACYFSRQKTGYVKHLAEAIIQEKLDLLSLEALSDDEVRARLTSLKGIGNWTAEIYLIFVLQRADIFPLGDLAAVIAMKRLKQLARDTPREQLSAMTVRWQPFRTIATMILWHYYLSAPKNIIIDSL